MYRFLLKPDDLTAVNFRRQIFTEVVKNKIYFANEQPRRLYSWTESIVGECLHYVKTTRLDFHHVKTRLDFQPSCSVSDLRTAVPSCS